MRIDHSHHAPPVRRDGLVLTDRPGVSFETLLGRSSGNGAASGAVRALGFAEAGLMGAGGSHSAAAQHQASVGEARDSGTLECTSVGGAADPWGGDRSQELRTPNYTAHNTLASYVDFLGDRATATSATEAGPKLVLKSFPVGGMSVEGRQGDIDGEGQGMFASGRLPQTAAMPLRVSLAQTGGNGVAVTARALKLDDGDAERLQSAVREMLDEFGLSLDSLIVNGRPISKSKFSLGVK